MIGLGTYQPDGLTTLTAEPIVDRLLSTLDDIHRAIYPNYVDTYTITSPSELTFDLSYIPIENSLHVIINGVTYYNNDKYTYFMYDRDNNNIVWIFRDEFPPVDVIRHGFDFRDGFSVNIVYNIDLSTNNITDINEIQ